jgi:hypothetical protein
MPVSRAVDRMLLPSSNIRRQRTSWRSSMQRRSTGRVDSSVNVRRQASHRYRWEPLRLRPKRRVGPEQRGQANMTNPFPFRAGSGRMRVLPLHSGLTRQTVAAPDCFSSPGHFSHTFIVYRINIHVKPFALAFSIFLRYTIQYENTARKTRATSQGFGVSQIGKSLAPYGAS